MQKYTAFTKSALRAILFYRCTDYKKLRAIQKWQPTDPSYRFADCDELIECRGKKEDARPVRDEWGSHTCHGKKQMSL